MRSVLLSSIDRSFLVSIKNDYIHGKWQSTNRKWLIDAMTLPKTGAISLPIITKRNANLWSISISFSNRQHKNRLLVGFVGHLFYYFIYSVNLIHVRIEESISLRTDGAIWMNRLLYLQCFFNVWHAKTSPIHLLQNGFFRGKRLNDVVCFVIIWTKHCTIFFVNKFIQF